MNYLIVGLGNPGIEHETTRHNIGFITVDNLSFYSSLNWQNKFKGEFSSHTIGDDKFYILKPQTFMNLSGESVSAALKFYKIEIENMIVVHDELDFAYGRVSFKNGGGLAGHNGLKSIVECIGTKDFKRLRIGIGRPEHGSCSNWVLSNFRDDDLIILDKIIEGSVEAIEYYMEKGFDSAIRKFKNMNFNVLPQEKK